MFKFNKISMLLGSFVAISPIMIAASCEKKNENKQDTNKNNNQNNLMLNAQNNNSNTTQDSKNDNKDLMSQAQGDDPNVMTESEKQNDEKSKSSEDKKKDESKNDLDNKNPSVENKKSKEVENKTVTPKVIIKSVEPKKRNFKELFDLIKEYSSEFSSLVLEDKDFLESVELLFKTDEERKLSSNLLQFGEKLKQYSSHDDPKFEKELKKYSSSKNELEKQWIKSIASYDKIRQKLLNLHKEFKSKKNKSIS